MPSKKKIKILIIDDDVVFLNSLLAKLAVSKFSVKGAFTGSKGLDKIQEWNPDLIILDLMLPDIDGLELLSYLRDNNKTKQLPVMVCTNRDERTDPKTCYSLGVKDFLLKVHYSLDQLVEKIEEATKK